MKKLSILLFVLVLSLASSFISCKKASSLLEMKLNDVQFVINLNVAQLSTTSDGTEFGGSGVFDPNDSPELANYLELVHSVEVTEIKVKVTSVTPATGLQLYDASFTLTDLTNGANFKYSIPSSMPIAVGSEIVINSIAPNFGVVSKIINDMHAGNVITNGHVSQAGFSLGFEYTIKANITVGLPEGK